MNTNSVIISVGGVINAFVNGKPFTLAPGGHYYPMALEAAKARNYKKLVEAIDLDKNLKNKSDGKVTFEGGVLRYNGSLIDNKLSRRVLELVGEGHKLDPFIKFMELCYQNPNPSTIDRLWDFLVDNSIMLGDNGYIVGYKGIRQTGYDWYSNTVLYEVGKVTKIPRSECDEDSRNVCSSGLHLGNLSYARGWVKDGKLILCQINPKNVTAIPEEHGYGKLRCCEMEVLEDVSYLKIEGVFQESGLYIGRNLEGVVNEFGEDSENSDDEYHSCGDDSDGCSNCGNGFNNGCVDLNGNHFDNDENNSDDDLDYDKYFNGDDTPTGWGYEDEQEYNYAWGVAIKNRDEVSDKGTVSRDRNGRFVKGNAPVNQKRAKNGRFC